MPRGGLSFFFLRGRLSSLSIPQPYFFIIVRNLFFFLGKVLKRVMAVLLDGHQNVSSWEFFPHTASF